MGLRLLIDIREAEAWTVRRTDRAVLSFRTHIVHCFYFPICRHSDSDFRWEALLRSHPRQRVMPLHRIIQGFHKRLANTDEWSQPQRHNNSGQQSGELQFQPRKWYTYQILLWWKWWWSPPHPCLTLDALERRWRRERIDKTQLFRPGSDKNAEKELTRSQWFS